jgi:hypothetical protein
MSREFKATRERECVLFIGTPSVCNTVTFSRHVQGQSDLRVYVDASASRCVCGCVCVCMCVCGVDVRTVTGHARAHAHGHTHLRRMASLLYSRIPYHAIALSLSLLDYLHPVVVSHLRHQNLSPLRAEESTARGEECVTDCNDMLSHATNMDPSNATLSKLGFVEA